MAYKDKTEAIRYNNQFNKDNYDRISLIVQKGRKADIKAAADSYGVKVNTYINALIKEALKHEADNPGGYFHIFSKEKSPAD